VLEDTGGHLVTLEQNKALARRELEELWSAGNLAVADEIFGAT
jgi:hypothetical protein